MPDPLNMLAVFMTGSRVAKHSVGLELGGQAAVEANAFFALRSAFGVSGYMTADEARQAIDAALATHSTSNQREEGK